MASSNNEIVTDFFPILRIYKDGTVERIFGSPYVPPSPKDPTTGVSSKDISISLEISARLYLPPAASSKLPVLVYFHGGAFCVESAFSAAHHAYLNAIVSESGAIAISVEYRSAPDRSTLSRLPTKIVGRQSSGSGHIVLLLLRRQFQRWSPGSLISAISTASTSAVTAPARTSCTISCSEPGMNNSGGIDDPAINPFTGPSLKGLRCSRLLVCVSEKDELRERGVKYCEVVGESGWEGEVELVQVEGEDHCFHIFGADSDNARNLTKKLASFIV
ncbi:hypothetical protein LguiA_030883 [Lonicera macranthoides]